MSGRTPSSWDPSLPDNKAEADAARDAQEEEKETGRVDYSKPDWAKDMPDPGDKDE